MKKCNCCQEEKPREDFHLITRRSGPHVGYSFRASFCKPCEAQRQKEYTAVHQDRRRAAFQKHAEYRLANDAEQWRESNNAKAARYRETHRDEINVRNRVDRDTEPVMRRNALKRQNTVGKVSYQEILERDGPNCYLCGAETAKGVNRHFDHVIPISAGGPHSMDNIRVACKPCNLTKGRKLLQAVA